MCKKEKKKFLYLTIHICGLSLVTRDMKSNLKYIIAVMKICSFLKEEYVVFPTGTLKLIQADL